jgi:glycosyltransferase involved in cell wall biosynthesis
MSVSSEKINILFIITLLERMGGAEKNLFDVVSNLDQEQFHSYVVAFKGGDVLNHLKAKGFNVYEYGITKLVSLLSLRKAWELRCFIKQTGIDIIVTYHHDADIWGHFVSLLAGGLPLISSRRDMGFQLTAKHIWFYRIFGRRFSKLITVSDAVKGEISRREWIAPDRMITIHNGLIPGHYKSSYRRTNEIRQELGLSAGDVIIGSVASFRPIKGQLYLVEAMKEVVAEFNNVRVVFVGYNDTEYFSQVDNRVQELSLGEHFIFTGARADIPDLLSAFDIFVISSVNEGFSNAIIEAMAAGKAVIAANSGGNPESIQDGTTGLLFPACDSHALAEKLRMLIRDQHMRAAMGKNGMAAVEKNFRLDAMVRKVQNLLKDVTDCEKKNQRRL